MKALDTNVLVRLLVRDDERQAQRARQLLLRAQEAETPLLVTDAVVLEVIWVLGSAYAFPRDEILDALELLADFPALRLQSHDVVRQLVRVGRSTRLDLADLLIGLAARNEGCESTLTFDRRLARSELFTAVP
jgi:predicted nucleic-acid-binding protein